jgi:hypothetical protein
MKRDEKEINEEKRAEDKKKRQITQKYSDIFDLQTLYPEEFRGGRIQKNNCIMYIRPYY